MYVCMYVWIYETINQKCMYVCICVCIWKTKPCASLWSLHPIERPLQRPAHSLCGILNPWMHRSESWSPPRWGIGIVSLTSLTSPVLAPCLCSTLPWRWCGRGSPTNTSIDTICMYVCACAYKQSCIYTSICLLMLYMGSFPGLIWPRGSGLGQRNFRDSEYCKCIRIYMYVNTNMYTTHVCMYGNTCCRQTRNSLESERNVIPVEKSAQRNNDFFIYSNIFRDDSNGSPVHLHWIIVILFISSLVCSTSKIKNMTVSVMISCGSICIKEVEVAHCSSSGVK